MTDRKTLVDIAMGLDPNGNPAIVHNQLARMWPMLLDAPAVPSNADMGNEITIRTGLPSVSLVGINQGIAKSKSSKSKRVDTMGLFGGRSEVDAKIKLLHGMARIKNEREKENEAFIEAFGQTLMTYLLYGDENTDSRAFTGFAPRMAALATDLSGAQVHSMGSPGGGDTTSVYVVDWGSRGAQLIYPKHGELSGADGGKLAAAGLRVIDKGEVEVLDDDDLPFGAFVTEYQMAVGLTINDTRHIARLANIDTSDALGSATQGSLHKKLSRMLVRMGSPEGMQRVIYCDRNLFSAFNEQANDKTNLALTREEYLGKMVPHYQGFPIRSVDAISGNESTVS
jgi:hypothetical protein